MRQIARKGGKSLDKLQSFFRLSINARNSPKHLIKVEFIPADRNTLIRNGNLDPNRTDLYVLT